MFPCIMGIGPRIGPLTAGANGQFWADDQINGTGSVVIGLDFSSSFSGGVTKIYSRDSLISADNKTTAAAPPQGCLPATPRAGSPTPNHCYFPTALLPPSHT